MFSAVPRDWSGNRLAYVSLLALEAQRSSVDPRIRAGSGRTRPIRSRLLFRLELRQILRRYRQLADAFASSREDGVANGRSNGRHGRLAHASRHFLARDDVDLHLRAFVHAQWRVRIEVRLHDAALFDGDFALERLRESKDHRAHRLLLDNTRVDDLPAVERADHAVHFDAVILVDRDFGDLSDIGVERLEHRDSAIHTLRKRLAPTRLFGD